MAITTREFVLPVVGNIEATIYIDNLPGSTGCSIWRLTEGSTTPAPSTRAPPGWGWSSIGSAMAAVSPKAGGCSNPALINA